MILLYTNTFPLSEFAEILLTIGGNLYRKLTFTVYLLIYPKPKSESDYSLRV